MRVYRERRNVNGKIVNKSYRYFSKRKEGAGYCLMIAAQGATDFFCDEKDFYKALASLSRYAMEVYGHNFITHHVINAFGSVDRADVSGAERRAR